jgi:hypothetical protein
LEPWGAGAARAGAASEARRAWGLRGLWLWTLPCLHTSASFWSGALGAPALLQQPRGQDIGWVGLTGGVLHGKAVTGRAHRRPGGAACDEAERCCQARQHSARENRPLARVRPARGGEEMAKASGSDGSRELHASKLSGLQCWYRNPNSPCSPRSPWVAMKINGQARAVRAGRAQSEPA